MCLCRSCESTFSLLIVELSVTYSQLLMTGGKKKKAGPKVLHVTVNVCVCLMPKLRLRLDLSSLDVFDTLSSSALVVFFLVNKYIQTFQITKHGRTGLYSQHLET